MTEKEIPKDASLLRCTLKKSAHVTEKWMVVAAVIIDVLALVYVLFYGCIYLIPIFNWIVGVINWIPLWFKIAAGIITSIVGYSFLWCVNRDLTDEDYKSDCCGAGAILLCIMSILLAVIGIVSSLTMNSIIPAILIIPFCIIVVDIIRWGAERKDTSGRVSVEFPGAAIHHYLVDKVVVASE